MDSVLEPHAQRTTFLKVRTVSEQSVRLDMKRELMDVMKSNVPITEFTRTVNVLSVNAERDTRREEMYAMLSKSVLRDTLSLTRSVNSKLAQKDLLRETTNVFLRSAQKDSLDSKTLTTVSRDHVTSITTSTLS